MPRNTHIDKKTVQHKEAWKDVIQLFFKTLPFQNELVSRLYYSC